MMMRPGDKARRQERGCKMSVKRQAQREYLAGLQAARLQGCTVDASYWQARDHSSTAKPVATVEPDSRVAPTSVEPLRVNECKGLMASTYANRLRRTFIDAQSAQRQAVNPVLAALTAFLSPAKPTFLLSDHPTYATALESLYASYRQSAREVASLMQRAPHDGRPSMAIRPASTVGAMQVRYSDRWQSSPCKPSDCRSLHTVPMQRGELVNVAYEWRAAIDRGCTVTVFAAADVKPSRSRSSGKVAPTIKRHKVTAADLPPVFAD